MIIDVNVSIGRWPFLHYRGFSPARILSILKKEGIDSALVSSIDAILYPDPVVPDQALVRQLKPYPQLKPVLVINPLFSNWRESLEEYGNINLLVKLFPNYHRYSLLSPQVKELIEELAKRKDILMIQMRLEDERTQSPLMKVPGVSVDEVTGISRDFPEIPVIALCPYFQEAVNLIKETKNIYVDISFIEKMETIPSLLKEVPCSRVLFGSHTPFLYARSAILKLREPGLDKRVRELIFFKNFQRITRG
jgi:hypothetical protein